MPRLAPSLLRYAASHDTHLARLLRECRDLASATNELRWLSEHAHGADNARVQGTSQRTADARLTQYVRRRSRGEPLQYILGNQPFGDLDIRCRKKVLIPRPETELYTIHLARLITKLRQRGLVPTPGPLRIADACTGTGCIALLLHALLCPIAGSPAERFHHLHITGLDISTHALTLADENLRHNLALRLLHPNAQDHVSFQHQDVLQLGQEAASQLGALSSSRAETRGWLSHEWHVIVSNPPYISPQDYAPGGTVGRSVRDHEPKLALVPPPGDSASERLKVNQSDRFYDALLHMALGAAARLLVMEIGDAKQASRVRELASTVMPKHVLVETWRDDGSVLRHDFSAPSRDDRDVAPERAVVVWIGSWAGWRRENR